MLENILDLWVEKMVLLEQEGDDPAEMLRNYIRGKVELSRSNPNASKVFAIEINQRGRHSLANICSPICFLHWKRMYSW